MTMSNRRLSRRRFLSQAAAVSPALFIRQTSSRFASNPFTLGVASGHPLPDGFVIWTRLAPMPLYGGGMGLEPVLVDWEVAEDEGMTHVVRKGKSLASHEWAHTLHVEVEGLSPERWYWYRFHVGSEESPVGRSRTAPALDASVEFMRFAFASCQHYEHGYFSAYRHMVDDDPQLIVHLGDYIYEEEWGDVRVRRHEAPEPATLWDYRNRYAEYKSDPDLQSAHAACPWLVTWDDHEVDNDYANLMSEELHPEAWFRRRREAAYRAYYEHMPLRRGAAPLGEHLRLYTQAAFGRLARFFVLDDRQYRSPQACPEPGRGGSNTLSLCPERLDPARTLLGREQEAWLDASLEKSDAQWNILAQQTLMAELDLSPGEGRRFWTDGWDGYPEARARLLRSLHEKGTSNPIVIGGDVHMFWVGNLTTDFRDEHAPVVASEIVGSSITSHSGETADHVQAMVADNPHLLYGNPEHRGYVLVELTRLDATTRLRGLHDVTAADSGVRTLATYAIENGKPGPQGA